jgi:hypothetical protein
MVTVGPQPKFDTWALGFGFTLLMGRPCSWILDNRDDGRKT